MSLSPSLRARSQSKCELCGSDESIKSIVVSPKSGDSDDDYVVVCSICEAQISNSNDLDAHHLRCLTESCWSQVPAVQVTSYRMLKQLSGQEWAQDALGMVFLADEVLEWAEANNSELSIVHKDSNGNILENGDSVTLIQDLNVKGANFTAKRGAAVRRIRLVHDNSEQIEGKVDGQLIVILTKFVKKT